MPDTEHHEPRHLRQARHIGADAALAAASWVVMSEADAASILDDVDPAVLDNYREPNLSGEFADDPTPASLAREVGANDGDIAFYGPDLLDEVADAWEEGRDAVWSDALQGVALRTLGRVDDALRVERECEATVDRLREASEADRVHETCPYCGPLTAAGTYRDPGDPPRARYCRRCGRPVVGADLTRDDTAATCETFTDLSGRVVEEITRAEYLRSRRHQSAGPASELVMSTTRERYAEIGATHWQLINDRGATVLRPVRVVDNNESEPAR